MYGVEGRGAISSSSVGVFSMSALAGCQNALDCATVGTSVLYWSKDDIVLHSDDGGDGVAGCRNAGDSATRTVEIFPLYSSKDDIVVHSDDGGGGDGGGVEARDPPGDDGASAVADSGGL